MWLMLFNWRPSVGLSPSIIHQNTPARYTSHYHGRRRRGLENSDGDFQEIERDRSKMLVVRIHHVW